MFFGSTADVRSGRKADVQRPTRVCSRTRFTQRIARNFLDCTLRWIHFLSDVIGGKIGVSPEQPLNGCAFGWRLRWVTVNGDIFLAGKLKRVSTGATGQRTGGSRPI